MNLINFGVSAMEGSDIQSLHYYNRGRTLIAIIVFTPIIMYGLHYSDCVPQSHDSWSVMAINVVYCGAQFSADCGLVNSAENWPKLVWHCRPFTQKAGIESGDLHSPPPPPSGRFVTL